MSMVIKGILAVFWLIFIPAAAGRTFLRSGRACMPGEAVLTGYLILFCLMEVLTLPLTWMKAPLHILTWCYGGIALILAAAGIVIQIRSPEKIIKLRSLKEHSVYFWAALAVIIFQVVICVLLAHMDADDSFYVAVATTDVQTDTIFEISPYSGNAYRALPDRYILSPFPVFLAVVSNLSGGLHPAIMAHMIFPAVFLPLSYLVLYKIAGKWFKEKRMQDVFVFICAFITSFSAYSVYNAENFRMVRIWQGKALLASMMLPLLFYICVAVFMEKSEDYPAFSPGIANLACCLVSSMGIILAPLMIGSFALVSLFQTKNFKNAGKMLLNCIPSILLGVLYLLFIRR